MLTLKDLRCNHERTPFGITGNPRFSWKLISDNNEVVQTAYRLTITLEGKVAADSGKITSNQSVDVQINSFKTEAGKTYRWQVNVWDNHGESAVYDSWFEAAPAGFQAKWIEPSNGGLRNEKAISVAANTLFGAKPKEPVDKRLMPVTLLRKEFAVKAGLRKARAYATAHGVYTLHFNGQKPDDRLLAPEYTSYEKYLCYQTYDITGLLTEGQNACGIHLADGWWGGRIGMSGECGQYGLTRALLLQIELEYADGSREVICSDESFKWNDNSTLRYSDLFIGEKQDNTYAKNTEGFDRAGFDDSSWQSALTKDYGYNNLRPQIGEPIVKCKQLPVKEIITTPKGEKVLDFGQIIAGFVRMTIHAKAGTTVKLEHSEVLDEKGNYLNNIMGVNKDQTDLFVTCGEGEEVFEPQFTFHGFRYVRVTGIEDWNAVSFTAVAITSGMDNAASFACSNPLINQLYSNVRWSQYANMISIPTDCPQRERAGWTGDISVFAPTAAYNQDMQTFLTRWLENLQVDQLSDGQVPNMIPYAPSYRNQMLSVFKSECSAAWGDACILVPWVLYSQYGDTEILKNSYTTMSRWMEYIARQAETVNPKSFAKKRNKTQREIDNQKYLWNGGWHFGDWLIPSQSKSMLESTKSGKVTKEVIAPMCYANNAKLMAQIAKVIGKQEDAARYTALHQRIKEAFAETYIDENGRMVPDLQGIYVCALWHGLVPEALEQKVAAHLVELIHKDGGCLDTGFIATPVLLDVLVKYGYKEEAYNLLYQEKCPSWLYEVKHGATTIWENWRAITPEGKVSIFSYNHYALGCVFDWIYRDVVGINAADIAYKKIRIQPNPDETMQWAESRHESVFGEIFCRWEKKDGKFHVKVQIPCNTSAQIILPDGTAYTTGSGNYSYFCQMQQ